MSDEEITLTRQHEAPPRSLAMMLKNQYVSKAFLDVLGATELKDHEIIGLAGVISTRFVCMILATTKEDKIGLKGQDLRNVEERLAIKRRIMGDTNAMAFTIEDCYISGFALARQSLNRQSRKEGAMISMAPRTLEPAKDIGFKDKLFSKFGMSRKYENVYVERE